MLKIIQVSVAQFSISTYFENVDELNVDQKNMGYIILSFSNKYLVRYNVSGLMLSRTGDPLGIFSNYYKKPIGNSISRTKVYVSGFSLYISAMGGERKITHLEGKVCNLRQNLNIG